MQAIETKYLPATETKCSRIKATTGNGAHSLTIPYPHEETEGERAHWPAAYALACKLGWQGSYVGGGTRAGYVFVRTQGNGYVSSPYHVHAAACAP